MKFILESKNMSDYLAMSDIVDYNNPIISENAMMLFSGYQDDISLIEAVYHYVRDRILHSADITPAENEQPLIVTCSASETFVEKHGSCYSKSHLLAAFLRFMNIPCGFTYQGLLLHEAKDKIALHALNVVYVPSLKKWIRLDARGNKRGIKAEFSIDEERLAYTPDTAKGEFESDIIYASPPEHIIDTLLKHGSFEEFKKNYPSELL